MASESEEEQKKETTIDIDWNNINSNNKKTPITQTVKNALVAIIGINEYHKNTIWDNLDNVINDVKTSVDLWNGFFNYDTYILSNQQNPYPKRRKIYRKDITKFLNQHIRTPLNVEYNSKQQNPHDALIIMLFGHGANESLITSDGGSYLYQELKEYFNSEQITDKEFLKVMRLFIIDTCRGNAIPKIVSLRGPNNNNYNPELINVESNICTLHSTPKKYWVIDGGFMNRLHDTFKTINLNEYTLYDVFTQLGVSINELYCPQFESTNKFKTKFHRKSENTKKDAMHCPFEAYDEDKSEDSVDAKWIKVEVKPKEDKDNIYKWMKSKKMRYVCIYIGTIWFCGYAVRCVHDKYHGQDFPPIFAMDHWWIVAKFIVFDIIIAFLKNQRNYYFPKK